MSADDDIVLTVHPKCHPRGPLRAHLNRAGELVLSCFVCGMPVLVPGSLPPPDKTLARVLVMVAIAAVVAVIALVSAFYRPPA